MKRVVEDTGRDAPNGQGVSRRLLVCAFVVLLATLPCLALPWYYVPLPDGLAAGARGPLLPVGLGAVATLLLADQLVRPARSRRGWQVATACLVAAAVAGTAAATCLREAGQHRGVREPLGPAVWLGLAGFIAGGTLALLAASALHRSTRLTTRQRKELARAQERLDAALPPWPQR